jgi:hypothetical protein
MTSLVETPVPAIIAGVVAVAILAVAFFQTGRGVFLVAIGGAVLLTLAAVGVEYVVVTDREEVEAALYGLDDAILANDKNAVIGYLSPSAVGTRNRANDAFARFEVTRATITDLEITVNNLTSPPSAKAEFRGLIGVHDRQGMLSTDMYPVRFTINYRKEQGRWLITGHTESGNERGDQTQRFD